MGYRIAFSMHARPPRARGHRVGAWTHFPLACLAALALVAVAGCGSSKPAYCSDRANLEKTVKGVTNISASSPVSTLLTTFEQIQTEAAAAVSSAKTYFPSQTSAIKSSVATLTSDVKALRSSPSPAQIATIASDAMSVVNSVKSFVDATSSKCS